MKVVNVALLIGDIYKDDLPEPFTGMEAVFSYKPEAVDVEKDVLVDTEFTLRVKAFSLARADRVMRSLTNDQISLLAAPKPADRPAYVARRFVSAYRDVLLDPLILFQPAILVAGQTVALEQIVSAFTGELANAECKPIVIRFSSFYGILKGDTQTSALQSGYQYDMVKDIGLLSSFLRTFPVLRAAVDRDGTFDQALEYFNGNFLAGRKPVVRVPDPDDVPKRLR